MVVETHLPSRVMVVTGTAVLVIYQPFTVLPVLLRVVATVVVVVVTDSVSGTSFVVAGVAPWWAVLAVLARDLAVAAMAAYEALRGQWEAFRHMKARHAGKLTTALVFPWLVSLLVPGLEGWHRPLWVLAAGASLVAAADYAVQCVRLHRSWHAGELSGSGAPAPPGARPPRTPAR